MPARHAAALTRDASSSVNEPSPYRSFGARVGAAASARWASSSSANVGIPAARAARSISATRVFSATRALARESSSGVASDDASSSLRASRAASARLRSAAIRSARFAPKSAVATTFPSVRSARSYASFLRRTSAKSRGVIVGDASDAYSESLASSSERSARIAPGDAIERTPPDARIPPPPRPPRPPRLLRAAAAPANVFLRTSNSRWCSREVRRHHRRRVREHLELRPRVVRGLEEARVLPRESSNASSSSDEG